MLHSKTELTMTGSMISSRPQRLDLDFLFQSIGWAQSSLHQVFSGKKLTLVGTSHYWFYLIISLIEQVCTAEIGLN